VRAPQPNAIGAFTDVPGYPCRQVAIPVKFSAAEHEPRSAAPALGANTEAVLGALDLSAAQLAEALRGPQ
jgi:crotonobetainyl-CoA:carnitine CoA-transferase CaiB-like acyl-CoA transferase